MKKSLLFVSALIAGSASVFAQNPIPNPNFETWTTVGTVDNPDSWLTLNGKTFIATLGGSALPQTLSDTTVIKATNSTDIKGTNTAAVKTTLQAGAPLPGILASCDSIFVDTVRVISAFPTLVTDGAPRIEFFGGIAVSNRPASLTGIWRYAAAGGTDSASVNVLFTKTNGAATDTVGAGMLRIDSVSGKDWANFTCPITWQDPQGNATTATPDNAVIIFTSSSSTTNAVVGSTLYVDSLDFTAPSVAPALNCTPDMSIDMTSSEVLFKPDTTNFFMTNIGDSFNQTITVFVPDTVSMELSTFGGVVADIDSIKIMDIALPSFLTQTNGAPRGVIMAGSVGCFIISGTVTAPNSTRYVLPIKVNPFGKVISATGAAAAIATPGSDIQTSLTFIGGAAGLPAAANYKFDVGVVGIEDFSANGNFNVSGNYPNPFDNSTTINFNTSVSGSVNFVVVDVLGRQVYDTNITATAGSNTFTYSTDLAAGTYFFSLSDGTDTVTRKIVITD